MFDAIGEGHKIMQRSVSHDEALREAYAANPMQAVADVHELTKEVNELEDRVLELEVVEESLTRNLADTAFCPLCLIKDCPQYGKGDLGMETFELELVDREQCKKSIITHARKGAKEFVYGQRKD